MGIEIVPYRPELEQWYVYVHNEGYAGWDTSYETKRKSRPEGVLETFLAHSDSLYVGLVDLVAHEGDALMIDPLGVLPEYRRHGIGKKLVDAACSWAIQNGYTRLYAILVSGEPRQHKFYRNNGFRPVAFLLSIEKDGNRLEVSPEEYNEKYLDWTIRHFAYHYMRPLTPNMARNQGEIKK